MIIRARPKYLDNINNLYNINNYKIKENEFYFNSARASLKFYLNYLSKKNNKNLSIAMQSFNCHVVADAALEANCEIYLLDIKLIDFSISLKYVEKIANKIDILLLTHYQGIPNVEYLEIIEFCNQQDIIVIEDMAQTFNSSVNNIKVGTLGSASISSYAFDKPLSSFNGGKLEINCLDEHNIKLLRSMYINLENESQIDVMLDIKHLSFLYKYTTINYYQNNIDNYLLIRVLLSLKIPMNIIYRLLTICKYKYISKVINKLISLLSIKSNQIIITKMSQKKINLIKEQEKNYKYKNENIQFIEKLCKINNIPFINEKNLNIHWNRYSVLDKNNILKNMLLKRNIQVGNFNWSITLDEIYKNNHKVYVLYNLKNSSIASKNIINIPIWSKIYDK